MTIVTTVAEEEGIDPLELEPLHNSLETDALERLVGGDSSNDLRIRFQYHGYEITVSNDGQVDAERLT